jgi:hypothetical protein
MASKPTAVQMHAVRPEALVKPSMPTALAEDVRSILHQAVVTTSFHSYREVAEFARMALIRRTRATDWNVVIARGVYTQVRVRRGTSAIFSVPCLLGDLLLPTPTPGQEAAASSGAPSSPAPVPRKEHRFTALVFKTAGDPEPARGRVAWRGDAVEEGAKDEGAGDSAAASSPPAPAPAPAPPAEPQAQAEGPKEEGAPADESANPALAPTPTPTPAPTPRFRPQAPVAGAVVVASTIPQGPRLKTLLNLLGGAQRQFGLHDAAERDFCAALKMAATAEFGSTWHVLLGRADVAPGLTLAGVPADVAAAGGSTGGTRLLDAGKKKQAEQEREAAQRRAQAEIVARVKTHGTAGVDPTAHLPHFALDCARDGFLEVACAPHFRDGRGAVSQAVLDATPARYHVCLFRTGPGEGEEDDGSGGGGAGGKKGLAGVFEVLAGYWENKVSTLRTVLFAAAFGCLAVFCVFTFAYDNSCSRVIAYGMGRGNMAAYIPGLIVPQTRGDADAAAPTILDDDLTAPPPTGAAVVGGGTGGSIAARLGLGPLPPLHAVRDGAWVSGETGNASAVDAATDLAGSMFADAMSHVTAAFRIARGGGGDGDAAGAGFAGAAHGDARPGSFDAYLDAMLPPLAPERPEGWVDNNKEAEKEAAAGGGGWFGGGSSASAKADEAAAAAASAAATGPSPFFSTEDLGVPEACTRPSVRAADRRVLRSRSLAYAAMVFLVLSSVVRVVGRVGRQSSLRGMLKGMTRGAARAAAASKKRD